MDPENPYQPPKVQQIVRIEARKKPAVWGLAVICNLIFIPLYVMVFTASALELLWCNDVMARGARDYWLHGIASLVFLGICGASLLTSRKGQPSAIWLIIASPLLLLVLMYPGLNVVWKAVTKLFGF